MSPRTVSRILFGKQGAGKRVWYRASLCALVFIFAQPAAHLMTLNGRSLVCWVLAWIIALVAAMWVYHRITIRRLRNVISTRGVSWWLRGAITIGAFLGAWMVWWGFFVPGVYFTSHDYFGDWLITVIVVFLPPMFLAVRVYHHLTFVDRAAEPLDAGSEPGEPLPRDEGSAGVVADRALAS